MRWSTLSECRRKCNNDSKNGWNDCFMEFIDAFDKNLISKELKSIKYISFHCYGAE